MNLFSENSLLHHKRRKSQQAPKPQGLTDLNSQGLVVIPTGNTVDERLKSMQQHPLYHDKDDPRLFQHVTDLYKLAYPGPAKYDEFGKLQHPEPAITTDQVKPFAPNGVNSTNPMVIPPRKPLDPTQEKQPKPGLLDQVAAIYKSPEALLEPLGKIVPTGLKTIAMEIGGEAMDKHMASQVMQHFRNGDGQPVELSSEWLLSHKGIIKAEEKNQEALNYKIMNDKQLTSALSTLKEGESLNYTFKQSNPKVEAQPGSDLYYASNKGNLDVAANIVFTRKNGAIYVEGTHNNHWHDRYDWKNGTSFFNGFVTGKEMNDYIQSGSAKEFDMHGQWSGQITGQIPIDAEGKIGEPQMKWSRDVEMNPKAPRPVRKMDPEFYNRVTQDSDEDLVDNPPVYNPEMQEALENLFRSGHRKRGVLTPIATNKYQ